ncbi:MAG: carboxypeptidase regulatory-like domain-containing protein, partial [Capsulimonadaceae bacterium]|nr:carboxypeptidase regulatory-like domain-containing protein [Capsulimonadaceae bacterium]
MCIRRYRSLFSVLLALGLTFTATLLSVRPDAVRADSAAAPAPSATEHLSLDRTNLTPAAALDASPAPVQWENQAEELRSFINGLTSNILGSGQKSGPAWMKTTELSLDFAEHYRPLYAVTTIQPFSRACSPTHTLFWEGRYVSQMDNNTGNLGIGYRRLLDHNNSLAGVNAFYDAGFNYNLARAGAGAEYFNKLAEYRANFYLPVSGAHVVSAAYEPNGVLYTYVRAVQGFDYEAGTALSFARWLNLFGSGYVYYNHYSSSDAGYKVRGVAQLTPHIAAELGYDQLSNGSYAQLMYTLGDAPGPSLWGGSKSKPGASSDLSYKLLQKVDRDTSIRTETFTRFVAYRGSIQATVKNTTTGGVLQGAVVQVVQGSTVLSAATTNAAGVATFANLPMGAPYGIKATYLGHVVTSDAVNVSKNTTQAVELDFALPSFIATLTVLDASNKPIAGASVTATLTGITANARTTAAAAGTTVTVTTDSNGTATFPSLSEGTWTFVTLSPSGESITLPSAPVVNGSAYTVVLPASAAIKTGDIDVVVEDASSNVLSGASVTLQNGSTTVATGTSDSKGSVLFSGLAQLAAGSTYTVTVSLANYVTSSADVTVTGGQDLLATVNLPRILLASTITVTSDGTTAVSGASVTLNGVTVVTGANGQAAFTGLASGAPYPYTVSATNYNAYSGSATAGTNATATLVRTLVSETITVTSDGTTPISGASVTLSGVTVVTGANGQAAFSGLASGALYAYTVSAANYNAYSGSATAGTNATATLVRTLVSETITVTSDGTTPIAGASVTLNGVTVVSGAN